MANLFAQPLGHPVTPDAVNERFEGLCARTGTARPIMPHICRHAFASNVVDAGGALDMLQRPS